MCPSRSESQYNLSLTSLSAAYDETIWSEKLSEKQHIPVAKLVQTILAQHTASPFTKLYMYASYTCKNVKSNKIDKIALGIAVLLHQTCKAAYESTRTWSLSMLIHGACLLAVVFIYHTMEKFTPLA